VGADRGGRMSRRRKRDAVLRLLRGEDLDRVSRSLGAAAATLSGRGDTFLDSGEASLATSPPYSVRAEGAHHLWRKVPPGELSITPVADEQPCRVTGLVEAS
jgi:hypothetical protein